MNEIAAVDVALDALIQMKQTLPSSALMSVSERRPEQALILASFASREDADVDEFLFDVLRANHYVRWFAAANLLLQRRTPGLASSIISSLRLAVHVYITAGNNGSGGGSGSGMGFAVGCGAVGAAPGLPPWAHYRLVTAAHAGLVVLSPGPTTVYYQRILALAGSTPSASNRRTRRAHARRSAAISRTALGHQRTRPSSPRHGVSRDSSGRGRAA